MESFKPESFSDQHNYGLTPFGIYCLDCNTPIGNGEDEIDDLTNTIRTHEYRQGHKHAEGITPLSIATEAKSTLGIKFGHLRDLSPWITKRNIKSFSCSCGKSFTRADNLQRHIKKAEKTDPEGMIHQGKTTLSVVSVCGRYISQDKINAMIQEPIHAEASPSSTNSTLTANARPGICATAKYDKIEYSNRRWIETTLEHVRTTFHDYKRVDESLESYLPSLKLLMLRYNEPTITNIAKDLKITDKSMPNQEDGATVNYFIGCCRVWIKKYCREHVNVLDGQTLHNLQSFFDESIMLAKGYQVTFAMREREDTILNELILIIKLSWSIYENKNSEGVPWLTDIEGTIQTIEGIKMKYKGVVNDDSVREMIESLCIQYYLHSILTESRCNAYTMLVGHQVAMMRLFKLKKEKSLDGSNEELSLSMVTCSEFASTVGLHLHIYRLGTASLMACTESKSWNIILNEVSNAKLCHVLSPLIKKARVMDEKKVNVRVKMIKDNGDIIVDDYVFPKVKWSQLIPKLNEAFKETFELIFSGDDWKALTNVSNSIVVEKIVDATRYDKNDILHYKFNVNTNGRIVSETDLCLCNDIHSDTFEKLNGLVMISLHGTGLGSARLAELFRIQMHQISWKRNNIYYVTESKKRGKAGMTSNKLVTHKLPASLSRYLLLYDYVGMRKSNGREQFLFGLGRESIECYYENQFFYTEFAKIFNLTSTCGSLIMRHLYTQICNYLFPNSSNTFDHSTVSTMDAIAEMTHHEHYGSSINEEVFFDTYHRSIGSTDILLDCDNRIISTSSESDILQCLQVLLGLRASFMSNLQKSLLFNACNNHLKHTFCSMGCGGGKSMAWLIPAVRQMLLGQRPILSIVIVPYCFLLEHHVSTSRSILGHCTTISIASLKGSNVERNDRPNVLKDKDLLPSILFLSLEAMSRLVEFHFEYMKELTESQSIFKIYVDECHTILSEYSFRNKYVSLRRLAALKIPIMSLSGSYQRSFINGYMNYMFGSTNQSMFHFIVDPNLFGKTLLRIQHHASGDYVGKSCELVRDFMEKNKDAHIHVIVSTKVEGQKIYDTLNANECDCEFIYSGSENQSMTATKWNDNKLKILISTTVGLVGNESSKTQLVCIVGLLYNIQSIIQSIGRIRPACRTGESLCAIFTLEDNSQSIQHNRSESTKLFIELSTLEILKESDRVTFERANTATSVNNWLFDDKGCRMVSLASRLGFQQTICKLCDRCTNTSVNAQGRMRSDMIEKKRNQKRVCIQLLTRLKLKCFVCNSKHCGGNCVVRGIGRMACFHCLGSHSANACKRYHVSVLRNKACFSCYLFNYEGSIHHDNTVCRKNGELKERLRGLLQYHYLHKTDYKQKGKSFVDFLGKVYTSEDTFFDFLYMYRDWK